ncbi:MAG: hypothetical protein JSV54_07510, partial [Chloroflexota bacterium]
MQKIKGLIIGTTLLILVLMPGLACYTPVMSPSPHTIASDIPGYLTYIDESAIFSICYPEGWEAGRWNLETFVYETTAEEGLKRLESGLPIHNYYTIFAAFKWVQQEIVAGVFIKLSGRFLGDPYRTIDEAEKGQKRTCLDFVELSRTPVNVNGREGTIREWEGTLAQGEGQIKEYHLELYLPTNLAIWEVSCSADSDNSTEWQNTFNNIVRSLRIY